MQRWGVVIKLSDNCLCFYFVNMALIFLQLALIEKTILP